MNTNMPTMPSAPASVAGADLGTSPGSAVPATAPVPIVSQAPAMPIVAQKGAFLQGVTLGDVGMIAIIVFTFSASVYASISQVRYLRSRKNSETLAIDELKSNMQTLMGEQYHSFS